MKKSSREVFFGILCIFCVTLFVFFYNSNTGNFESSTVVDKSVSPGLKSSNIRDPRYKDNWIVVTSINKPTEDIKRLVKTGWNVVVVGDKKTPVNWELEGVHYLSVKKQKELGLSLPQHLPFGTYTRKNVGYLYAIKNGAQWIYDTDDDNKPYGLGLHQFDYGTAISGVRWQKNENASLIGNVFNPYNYFGNKKMWPRGFPLEFLSNHTNGVDRMLLCKEMRPPAVQQGLVHKDPDVDAIYRIMHADRENGLNEKFNRYAPPVTLEKGTYAPWNSQNTLFHRNAFFTMFLPTSVAFRVTDIWRSFFAQKLLHLVDETIGFYPVNAIQIRNAHDYLADFEDERAVYLKSGKILDFLDSWECDHESIKHCMVELARRFSRLKFFEEQDAELIELWLEDLEQIGYEFPSISNGTIYKSNDTARLDNCHRIHIDFAENSEMKKAEQKLRNHRDILDYCDEYGKVTHKPLLSATRIDEKHANMTNLKEKGDTAMLILGNWPFKNGIGMLQRLYEPYFAAIVLCGTWDPSQYVDDEDFPAFRNGFNYIHMSQEKIKGGHRVNICLSKMRDLRLQNIKGVYVVADDTVFNFWTPVNQNLVVNPCGVNEKADFWWNVGAPTAKEASFNITRRLIEVEYKDDVKMQALWKEYDRRTQLYSGSSAKEIMETANGNSLSDFYFVPSHELDFYADMHELFYEGELFMEMASTKLLYASEYEAPTNHLYMWAERPQYDKMYNSSLMFIHAVKFGLINNSTANAAQYCSSVIRAYTEMMYS